MNQLTQKIDLPSKGYPYSSESPLSKGFIQLKYPTACQEDILTNPQYVSNGTWMDEFVKALIVDSTINYDQILLCDKESLIIYSRIMAYGSQYKMGQTICRDCLHKYNVDVMLNQIKTKQLSKDMLSQNNNLMLKFQDDQIQYKLLNSDDEKKIKDQLKGYQKLSKSMRISQNIITLKYSIVSINKNNDSSYILNYLKNMNMLRFRKFKRYITDTLPGVQMNIQYKCPNCSSIHNYPIKITFQFFWPEF